MTRTLRVLAVAGLLAAGAHVAGAREPGDPIVLAWVEGDVAGFAPIVAPAGGEPIGFVEFHQHREGDVLDMTRVARFTDGSSDEDRAVARVGRTLDALEGRSIIRDARGRATVDLHIDVRGGRVSGFYDDGTRHDVDQAEDLPPATYWGPLIFLVLKNFEANAEDDRVRFRTVVPTPRPRVLTLELVRDGTSATRRPGGDLALERFTLRPTIAWLVDPILHALLPATSFFVQPGTPPAFARFDGPRNFGGQEIRLE
jgi:hypothetical protein